MTLPAAECTHHDRRVTTHLETERLLLRELTTDDVQNLVDLDADPEVARWVMEPAASREEVEQDLILHYLPFYERTPGFGFWAIEEKASGEFLGWFHLRPRDGHGDHEPELGYRLRRSAWGKGYATEGSVALINKAFAEHPIARVLAETGGFHTASRRVMEKSGLRLVREFDAGYPPMAPEDVHGEVEYAITRDEWERQHPGGGRAGS